MSGDGLQAAVFWLRRERPVWAVPLLLFLAVLLVSGLAFNLANLDTGGETIPAVTNPSDSPPAIGLEIDPALVDILLMAFAGVGLATTIYAIVRNRSKRKRPTKPRSRWEVLASVLGLLMILALLLAWPRMVQALQAPEGTEPSDPEDPVADGATAWPRSVGAPLALFLALTVLVTLLVLGYTLRRAAGPIAFETLQDFTGTAHRRAAARAVQTAIEELELGADVRTAILGCFQRFCGLLGARGITGQDALTPRELEGIAVERLRVSREASGTLTSLFEEARYSEHPLGESDRTRAVESLAGIRAALGA